MAGERSLFGQKAPLDMFAKIATQVQFKTSFVRPAVEDAARLRRNVDFTTDHIRRQKIELT